MSWSDLRPWGIKWRHIALGMFALILLSGAIKSCGSQPAKSGQELRVAAGTLEMEWPRVSGQRFNVVMINGRYAESRSNDIEELAKDYWHFKNAAVDALANGDLQRLASAENGVRETERFLAAYHDSDVRFILHATSRGTR